jgi:hypothetical protein
VVVVAVELQAGPAVIQVQIQFFQQSHQQVEAVEVLGQVTQVNQEGLVEVEVVMVVQQEQEILHQ